MMHQNQGTKLGAGGNERFKASALLGMHTGRGCCTQTPECLPSTCATACPWHHGLHLETAGGVLWHTLWVCRGRRQLGASLAGLKHIVLLLLCSKAESLSTLLLCEATHRRKNITLSPVVARGLCLDNIHSALQVIILGLFLEGNRRDTAWLLLFSVMREKYLQCGSFCKGSVPSQAV